ncbi:MAG: anhydro-N-acetylmuramic acid kinase [Flavobacteriales bacterium]
MSDAMYMIGAMSGTSCDGLDLVLASFSHKNRWESKIIKAQTFDYTRSWREKLLQADQLSGVELMKLDADFGIFTADCILEFLSGLDAPIRSKIKAVASHGHTVFHQPEHGFTVQIGSGAHIAARTGIICVCDFRSTDVAAGGQGAPLVPFADQELFGDFDACLNLGGFANVSFAHVGKRIAYDICPVNIVLNALSRKLGQEFDAGGKLAAAGKIIESMLQHLNDMDYYKLEAPKSLGKEFCDHQIFPLLDTYLNNHSLHSVMHTFVEHIAMQIAAAIKDRSQVLVTGGGAYNQFLIEKIKAYYQGKIIIPDNMLINFKEALAFAFLGLCRLSNKINIFSSVTGSSNDHSGGAVYLPVK